MNFNSKKHSNGYKKNCDNNQNNDEFYYITKEQAEEIASDCDNLIHDYNKRTKNKMNITIDKTDINLVSKDGKIYWLVQVLSAETFGYEKASFFDRLFYGAEMEDVAGEISDQEDLKLLRCLIDAKT